MKKFSDDSRPNIAYPTRWTYTVIGIERTQIESAVGTVVGDRSHKLSLSNTSSSGKYVSLALELIVLNEAERLHLFESLRDHPAITIVI